MSTLVHPPVAGAERDSPPEAAPPSRAITKRDFLLGTIIAIAMAIGFSRASHGWSLIVTFVPGTVGAWFLFAWYRRRHLELPKVETFLPAFAVVLAVQFIHFAEEFTQGFRTDFALLYDGSPYSENAFVAFNMGAYAVMTVAAVVALVTPLRFVIVPAMFFVVYGALGNAIAHTWWSIQLGEYFPGLYTAQLHWIGGPVLLYLLLRNRRHTVVAIGAFAAVLIPILALAADTSAI